MVRPILKVNSAYMYMSSFDWFRTRFKGNQSEAVCQITIYFIAAYTCSTLSCYTGT